MIGLSSVASVSRARAARCRRCWRSSARDLPDGQVHADHRPEFRRASRCSCRCASARSSRARRSSSRPRTACGCAAAILRARTDEQAGVIVYCHEYLSDRWSYQPYIDHLRDLGFDIFTFDFRNHGESDREPGYYADAVDLRPRGPRPPRRRSAYLRSRPDHDPAGFGLFGVSRGGTTALIAAAGEPDVWGVDHRRGVSRRAGRWSPTSSAGPRSTCRSPFFRRLLPRWLYYVLAWRRPPVRSERRLNCRFPERRSGGGTAGPSALADDPRRARYLHRPGDRAELCSIAARPQGAVAGAGGQAQPLPRDATPRPTPTRICWTFSTDSPRAVPLPAPTPHRCRHGARPVSERLCRSLSLHGRTRPSEVAAPVAG